MADLECGCGYVFDDALGEYGCPNCEGDEGPAAPVNDDIEITC